MTGLLAIRITKERDQGEIDAAMTIMTAAFPPEYGEAWSASQLASMLGLSGSILAVGRIDEEPVGFALLRSIAGEAELMLLAVHPLHRGLNHGRRLLDRCMSEAEETGAETIFLEVRDGNPAIHLYLKAGFRQYNTRRAYYAGSDGQTHDALSFKINLGQA